MKEKRFAGRVGLFVIVAAMVGAMLVYVFDKSGFFNPTYDLRLQVAEVGGLTPGAVVLLRGIVIGRVVDADVAPGGRGVHIRIRISQKYHIHSDAEFEIQQIGFLGDQSVVIKPRENQGPILEPNAVIENVKQPFAFDALGREASTLIAEFSKTAEILNEAIGRANRTVFSEQSLTNASATLAKLGLVSERAIAMMDTLNTLVQSNAPPVGLAISNFVQVSSDAGQLAISLREMVATNRQELSLALTNLRKAAEAVQLMAEDIADGKGLAGTLVKDGPFQQNVTNLVATLVTVSSNLNKYGLFYNTWLGRGPREPKPAGEPSRHYPGRNPISP